MKTGRKKDWVYHCAQGLSIVLHPLMMPSILFAVIIYVSPLVIVNLSPTTKAFLWLFVFLVTYFVPALAIYWFYKMGVISSVYARRRKDRPIPLLFTGGIYTLFTYVLGKQLQLGTMLTTLMLLITISVFAVAAISFWWKISAHSVGVAGLIGLMSAYAYRFSDPMLTDLLVAALIFGGLLMTARLYLNAHSPAQVYAGFGLGLVLSFPPAMILLP